MVSHGMAVGDAARAYLLLAIGDALVAQIPALMLSIAAAAIVTRVASSHDLAGQIGSQFGSARTWTPVAVILALLGVLPGMPHLIILPAAIAAGAIAWKHNRDAKRPAAAADAPAADETENGEWASLGRVGQVVYSPGVYRS